MKGLLCHPVSCCVSCACPSRDDPRPLCTSRVSPPLFQPLLQTHVPTGCLPSHPSQAWLAGATAYPVPRCLDSLSTGPLFSLTRSPGDVWPRHLQGALGSGCTSQAASLVSPPFHLAWSLWASQMLVGWRACRASASGPASRSRGSMGAPLWEWGTDRDLNAVLKGQDVLRLPREWSLWCKDPPCAAACEAAESEVAASGGMESICEKHPRSKPSN